MPLWPTQYTHAQIYVGKDTMFFSSNFDIGMVITAERELNNKCVNFFSPWKTEVCFTEANN